MNNLKPYMLSVMCDERKKFDAYILRVILAVFSFVYLVLLKCSCFFYDAGILKKNKAAAKVISVGNITLGGTGKTPFTIKLAKKLTAMGKKVSVLIRGYGDDEPHLLREKLGEIPVLIGKDRVKNAERAINELGSDCIILDDGFQHYRIERDLDIVLIDTTCPFENMRLFPRGILREPLSRLKNADIIILTKSDMGAGNVNAIRRRLERINGNIGIAESFYRPVGFKRMNSFESLPLSYIRGRKTAVVSGIANPKYFDWLVGNAGAVLRARFHYPDHHLYRESNLKAITKRCRDLNIDTVVTTEKDAVKLNK
ncbi:MAG: tetraacyldisaccharide 4'-kinase, partial [Candidatus Omnitrophota bacterium]|nr:tetraacyldisaccharide 4'-kinase [Candidatus Omnitrophota bacterium]